MSNGVNMKILVNGIEKELELRDPSNGQELTQDVIGNYEVLDYDKDCDCYIMAVDQFEWWKNVICEMQEIDNILLTASDELKFEFGKLDMGCSDLDDDIHNKLEWLRERIDSVRC